MTHEERLRLLITQLGADHKSQQLSIQTLTTAIGTLPSLSTTAKGNLVAAINEIFALATSGAGLINDALTTSTVKTFSIDKIKLEIAALKTELLGGIPAATLDTFKEISDAILADQTGTTVMVTAIGNRVSYTNADNKSTVEKAQARANIDAYGVVELGNPDTDLIALYTTAKA